MAHKVDAVSWWNSVGRKYGAKSKEVRKFMLNPDNYYLEHYRECPKVCVNLQTDVR